METATRSNSDMQMAALAHASPLIGMFVSGGMIGPVIPLLLWISYRESSPWVAHHALQSLALQIVVFVLIFVLVVLPWLLLFAFSFLTMGFGLIIAFPFMFLLIGLGAVLGFVPAIYQAWAAFEVMQGRDFDYLWIGRWSRQQFPALAGSAEDMPKF